MSYRLHNVEMLRKYKVYLYRRLSIRVLATSVLGLTIILCIYYISYTSEMHGIRREIDLIQWKSGYRRFDRGLPFNFWNSRSNYDVCPRLTRTIADIDTMEVFKNFEFQPTWMEKKQYWDEFFEERYRKQKIDPKRPPLKVIIVPHSHNDPAWLKTFDYYFHYRSSKIIDHVIDKLQQFKNFTFIWSEVVLLSAWWEQAHPRDRRALKKLVQSGKLEITTGGWVMIDEANTHIYAMVDQLIEGHQWILSNLGIIPMVGWSIDAFGHGSTQPHLLALAGLKGTVIQRIHYAWKQWLAFKQYGDFKWIPAWSPSSPRADILTHSLPFDAYTIKSCGPNSSICLNFDFRSIVKDHVGTDAKTITDKNVKDKSELLLEQYARTGSLYPHNVVLAPLGDDFRYSDLEEFDQQYANYMKIIEYINSKKAKYNAEISFGTPVNYFNEIMKRYDQYPTLKGDFFMYSDVYSEGRPDYWSVYFTTRPYLKILSRELESSLRGAEMVYTVALNHARQRKLWLHLRILERDFEKLVRSRRKLGLFQHHNAITGTRTASVMKDYGLDLFESIRDTVRIQQNAIQALFFPIIPSKLDQNLIDSDLEREFYETLPRKSPIVITSGQENKIVLYNTLSHVQDHLVQVRINTFNVNVLDNEGKDVIHQINPVWNISDGNTKFWITPDEYEVVFIARIPQMSLVTYTLTFESQTGDKLAKVYCNKYSGTHKTVTEKEHPKSHQSAFQVKNMSLGHIRLENHKFRLRFSGNTGFLKSVTRKYSHKKMRCAIQFAAYKSAQFHSRDHLSMPDRNEREIEKDVLQQYKDLMSIIITSGPVSSEITVIYGPFLVHSVAIYHVKGSVLSEGIYIENTIDFMKHAHDVGTVLFMRILSDVQNGDPPEFYTDQNGFQIHKRVKVERINVEGNYYPITTVAFIADENTRLSLLTNHAQGATSWQPGYLEVMLDRRIKHDNYDPGIGESVEDIRKTKLKFWLLIEDVRRDVEESRKYPKRFGKRSETYTLPSLYANRMSNLLNYPLSIFKVHPEYHGSLTKTIRLLNKPLACNLHVLNFRTQPDIIDSQFPSSSALLVLHRQGHDCDIGDVLTCDISEIDKNVAFEHAIVKELEVKTLSGINALPENIQKLGDIVLEPMFLKTVNVTFA